MHIANFRDREALGRVTLLLALAACSGGSDAPTTLVAGVPARIEAVGSVAFTGSPGRELAASPTVIVRDASGSGVPNVVVTFTITEGDGALSDSPLSQVSVITSASGTATSGPWRLGPVAGTNRVTASFGTLPPVLFVADARP